MSYIDESLSDGENVLGRFQLHWGAWLPVAYWLLLPLLAVPLGVMHSVWMALALGLALCVPALLTWLRLRGLEMGLTNKRVIHKTGVIGRKTDEMKLASIETVEIHQGVVGRILDYGTVRVTGKGVSAVAFNGVANPMAVKRQIEGVSNPAV